MFRKGRSIETKSILLDVLDGTENDEGVGVEAVMGTDCKRDQGLEWHHGNVLKLNCNGDIQFWKFTLKKKITEFYGM